MRRIVTVISCAVVLSACAGNDGSIVDDTAPASTDAVQTTVGAPRTTAANSATISVVVGENSAPDRIESVPLGASVEITFLNPDSHDEFHVHGYDLSTGTVEAGETATISFTADKAGTFEIESHETDDVVMILEVR